MPVISKRMRGFEGKQFLCTTKVDGEGQFTMTLPNAVHVALNAGIVRGTSLQEVEKKWTDAIKKYKESQTTTCKVILYKFMCTAMVMRDDRCVFRSSGHAQEIAFSTGTAMALSAAVYIEHATKLAAGGEVCRYEMINSHIPHGLCIGEAIDTTYHRAGNRLEWTQEREDFFAKLGTALEDLIVKLAEFTKDEKTLLKFISSQQKLLG